MAENGPAEFMFEYFSHYGVSFQIILHALVTEVLNIFIIYLDGNEIEYIHLKASREEDQLHVQISQNYLTIQYTQLFNVHR